MTPERFDEPSDEVLFRFIAGRCTTPEHVLVDQWVRRDPANRKRVEDIRRIWRAGRPAPTRDLDRMWTRLRAATEPRRSPRGLPTGVWAAAVVVLIGGGAIYLSRSRPIPKAGIVAALHAYATGPKQTANVRLRDGTRVTLAPMSRLLVPDDFGLRERAVTIDGQGFFDVVHQAAMPFRVRAKGTIAEDVGTQFDLRAYQDERGVVVIVVDGAVSFGAAHNDSTQRGQEGVIVRGGERGQAEGPDSAITVDRVSLRLVGWTDGHLAFVKTPLSEVVRSIGRWYDLDVRVTDAALAHRSITADFAARSPQEMVDALATAVHGVVTRDGRVLTIRAKP